GERLNRRPRSRHSARLIVPDGGQAAKRRGGSYLAVPATLRIELPIGRLETPGLGLLPALTGAGCRFRIIAIEEDDDPPICRGIGGRGRTIEQKPHARRVRIVVIER